MKRKIVFILIISVLLSFLAPKTIAQSAEDAVFVRKHVSILYDNSGSMDERLYGEKNLKWCYASYAAQVFTGLLNDTDSLCMTFMNGDPLYLDLKESRQDSVTAVFERTKVANADTPVSKIGAALKILENEGLKEGLGANEAGEQYWLVLTTDGVFRENGYNLTPDRVSLELQAIMQKYPDLHLVYFGIGTQNDNSESKAVDYRKTSDTDPAILDRLHAFPRFSAFYAESQEQIVATMQSLSNTISSRYSVNDSCEVDGNRVRIYLSGESSPIRNIALMAQETNAKLVSVSTENGTKLFIEREAEIRFPYNPSYDNVPDDTLGGYVALISADGGDRFPAGNIILEFSEPISKEHISLMYEPAIHMRLIVEAKEENDQWRVLPENASLVEGDEIRVSYMICEDGSEKELDTGKLFGKTESRIIYNGREIAQGDVLKVVQGDSLIDVNVSMMDGGYQIGASRTIHVGVPTADDLQVISSGPIELVRSDVAENSDRYVEYIVQFRGKPADSDVMSRLELTVSGASGQLNGILEHPQPHVFRFIPKDDTCKSDTYTVRLFCDDKEIASEEILILPNEVSYTADAGPGISILSTHVSDNSDYVFFNVTAHRDDGDEPIDLSEASLFDVKAERQGDPVRGFKGWQDGGVITFTLQDENAVPGDYVISLWKENAKLAETHITVIHHDAKYSVEAIVSDPDDLDRFKLNNNTANVSFIVYEDGIACSPEQLEAMINRQIFVSDDLHSYFMKMNVQIGMVKGNAAIICTPTSRAQNTVRLFFHRMIIATGLTSLNKDKMHIKLVVEMPYGSEAIGEMDLRGYEIIYLIVLLSILALLLLAFLFIFANLKAKRLMKGVIWTFAMRHDNHIGGLRAARTGSFVSTGWGWKPMIAIPVNESHNVSGVLFRAEGKEAKWKSRKKSSLFAFRRQHPTVEIKGTPGELDQYYYSDVSGVAARILTNIKAGKSVSLMNGDEVLDEDSFFSFVGKFADVDSSQKANTAQKTVNHQISSGSKMIYKVSGSGDNSSYTVWVYEAFSKSADKEKHSYYHHQKKKQVDKNKKRY